MSMARIAGGLHTLIKSGCLAHHLIAGVLVQFYQVGEVPLGAVRRGKSRYSIWCMLVKTDLMLLSLPLRPTALISSNQKE